MSQEKKLYPDPEVVPVGNRRRFSAAYKLRILTEADACTEPNEIGALLRREGLYSSHLSRWRRLREQEQLQGLSERKRGRKGNLEATELTRLRRENEQFQARLKQAEAIIDVQKKLCGLLGLSAEPGSEQP